MLITKSDGTQEEFDPRKLVSSLVRAGASSEIAEDVSSMIVREMRSGMTTSEIYRHAFSDLKSRKPIVAAKYSLKRAVQDFGPSGFPFESYLSKLFEAEGYETKVDQIIQGTCVEHEVDVVLNKGKELWYVEAKFHNSAGFKTDLKTVLYVKARMEDIYAARKASGEKFFGRGMVATNTKFTSHAVRYSQCAGLELLGWEYPAGDTLHDKIDKTGLYPITALTSLSRREKNFLLESRIVLCNDLEKHEAALTQAGVPRHKVVSVLAEARGLCVSGRGI